MSNYKGPLGIDPLQFSIGLFSLLVLFVVYLLAPRAVRKHYMGAYPKRHAWSARSRMRRSRGGYGHDGSSVGGSITSRSTYRTEAQSHYRGPPGIGMAPSGAGSTVGASTVGSYTVNTRQYDQEQVVFGGPQSRRQSRGMVDMQQNDEIVISAAMQQLRDPGVLIVAHGSRGKPKTVRLQLTESAVTWRTETRKRSTKDMKPKMGKLHQVPLSHIMYVDVGKQTTALRRVENASVSDALCFSLLTKEGSLDLEANSPRERDALVSCFSLVLDEVHAQNWRDIYRGPSSDMPSSFDEVDQQHGHRAAGP